MRQALHIFRKDVRFLWPHIMTVIGLTAVMTWGFTWDRPWSGIESLKVLSWWYLIAAAIYKEAPTGDRQFWITRPYDWKSLAAAKLLLIITFIIVPQFLSDVTVMAAHGLSPTASSLLLRQLVSTGLWVLPAAAIATVTQYAGQMGLTILATGLVVGVAVAFGFKVDHSSVEWMRTTLVVTILAGVGAAVLVWQYGQRRTAAARTALVATAVVCLACLLTPPIGAAIALLADLPAPQPIPQAHLCATCTAPDAQKISDRYPIRIEGLPEGMSAEPELLKVKIDGWSSGWLVCGSPWIAPDPRWVDSALDLALANGFQSRPVKLTISLVMTIYRLGTTDLPRDGRAHQIPSIGACSLDPGERDVLFLHCRTAGYPAAQIKVHGQTFFGDEYPYHAMFDSNPIFEFSTSLLASEHLARDITPVRLTIQQPVAHIRRDITMENIRLKP